MTLGLTEAAVVALDTYLEAQMAAKVTALNTRYGDAYTLENVKTWYPGYFPLSMPESPSVILHALNWSTRMQKVTDLLGGVRIDIYPFYGTDKLDVRFRKLCRYALGIIELCNTGQEAMGYSFRLAGPVALTESMAPPDFLQGVQIPILLEKMESF